MSPVFLFNAQFFAAFASYTSLFEFNKKNPTVLFFLESVFFPTNQPEPDLSVSKKKSWPVHSTKKGIPRHLSSSLSTTPWKINGWNLKTTQFRKENHLPKSPSWLQVPAVNLPGGVFSGFDRSKTMWRYVSASSPSVDCLWTTPWGWIFFVVGLRGLRVMCGLEGGLVDAQVLEIWLKTKCHTLRDVQHKNAVDAFFWRISFRSW